MERIEKMCKEFASNIEHAVREDIAQSIRASLGKDGAFSLAYGSTGRGKSAVIKLSGKNLGDGAHVDLVLAYVTAHPGERTEAISKAVGFHAKAALAKLRQAGRVATKGHRRITTYTAVS